jgi:hypothetical protein
MWKYYHCNYTVQFKVPKSSDLKLMNSGYLRVRLSDASSISLIIANCIKREIQLNRLLTSLCITYDHFYHMPVAPFLSPKVCFIYRRVLNLKGAPWLRIWWLKSLAGSQVSWWQKVHLSLVQEFLTGSKLFERTHSYAVDFDQPESLTAIQLAEWTCRMDFTMTRIFADDAEKVTISLVHALAIQWPTCERR